MKIHDVVHSTPDHIMQRSPSDNYLGDMEKNIQNKVNDIIKHISQEDTNLVIDVGVGSGLLTYHIAKHLPNTDVIGIDRNPDFVKHAQETYKLENLEYVHDDIIHFMSEFKHIDNIVMIFSSVMHEIFSYGSGLTSISHIISNCNANRIIIRDFVAPSDPNQLVVMHHVRDDPVARPFHTFAKEYQHFPILCTNMKALGNKYIYTTNMRSAYEYIYRKDFVQNWDYELQEQYGFWSKDIAYHILKSNGYDIKHCNISNNEWILKNRITPYITLYDDHENFIIDPPSYQMTIVADISHDNNNASISF